VFQQPRTEEQQAQNKQPLLKDNSVLFSIMPTMKDLKTLAFSRLLVFLKHIINRYKHIPIKYKQACTKCYLLIINRYKHIACALLK
jgi:hypothetical protein